MHEQCSKTRTSHLARHKSAQQRQQFSTALTGVLFMALNESPFMLSSGINSRCMLRNGDQPLTPDATSSTDREFRRFRQDVE